MNNLRRKALKNIINQLNELKDSLEDIQFEEDECRDNIPENLWGTERYEKAEEACGYLEDAVNELDEAISSIEAATE